MTKCEIFATRWDAPDILSAGPAGVSPASPLRSLPTFLKNNNNILGDPLTLTCVFSTTRSVRN